MRRSLLLVPLSACSRCVVAAPALAGGFATVGLSSTPEGVVPGKPWDGRHHGAPARPRAA